VYSGVAKGGLSGHLPNHHPLVPNHRKMLNKPLKLHLKNEIHQANFIRHYITALIAFCVYPPAPNWSNNWCERIQGFYGILQ